VLAPEIDQATEKPYTVRDGKVDKKDLQRLASLHRSLHALSRPYGAGSGWVIALRHLRSVTCLCGQLERGLDATTQAVVGLKFDKSGRPTVGGIRQGEARAAGVGDR
jgi:hypothetical protein